MNSFNHYAYGAVADWVYEEAAGIHTVEEAPGFERVKIAPKPDSRLDWLEAPLKQEKGLSVPCGNRKRADSVMKSPLLPRRPLSLTASKPRWGPGNIFFIPVYDDPNECAGQEAKVLLSAGG